MAEVECEAPALSSEALEEASHLWPQVALLEREVVAVVAIQ